MQLRVLGWGGGAAVPTAPGYATDVDQLKSRLIEDAFPPLQVFIDEAIRQWRPRHRACVRAHGGHFEHRFKLCLIFIYIHLYFTINSTNNKQYIIKRINTTDICTDVYTLTVIYVCAVDYSGHFCFGVTSLNPL